jgi:hypothetical protein
MMVFISFLLQNGWFSCGDKNIPTTPRSQQESLLPGFPIRSA